MTAEGALSDMLSVRKARLTLRRSERALARAGLRVVDSEFFVVRPDVGGVVRLAVVCDCRLTDAPVP
jgi:hypothetical protein